MDAPTRAALAELYARESRSLLQYVSEADPWTTRKDHHTVGVLTGMAEEERRGVAAVVRLAQRRHILLPRLASYPSNYTTINFVALDHLLPYLVEDHQKGVSELERQAAAVTDAEARAVVADYLALKQRHLKALSNLAASPSESAPA